MVEHLRNPALLLCAQRFSKHKNCRIGGLLSDSIYLKFNSKQSSTLDLAKEILHLFKHLSSEKRFYYIADKSDNHVLYHIASQVWQLLQYVSLSFSEEAAKKLRIVLQYILDVIFYPCVLQQFWVLKTIPTPAFVVAVMIWHSCYLVQTFKVLSSKYIGTLYIEQT